MKPDPAQLRCKMPLDGSNILYTARRLAVRRHLPVFSASFRNAGLTAPKKKTPASLPGSLAIATDGWQEREELST